MQGHAYHAEGPAGEGEAVLTEALNWWEASTTFDPSAAMSTRETIDLSEPEVVALPEVWPEETLREEEQNFGFENGVSSGQALVVLAGFDRGRGPGDPGPEPKILKAAAGSADIIRAPESSDGMARPRSAAG